MRAIVVGGGVSGLGAALALARTGHEVTVLERDATPLPASADEAFRWDRRGAPQVRHSHAFLARLRNLLRDRYPDVYAALLSEGITELRFGDDLPPTIENFVREPGDDDLALLAVRRTTFEWVVRRIVLAEGGVTIRDGVAVEGLLSAGGDPPVVTGVRLSGGGSLEADAVVVANGRRSSAPEWIEAIGGRRVEETVEDTGIVYSSRFYRLRDGESFPPRAGAIGGDLGYLKYGVFVGDNGTFSVTLAVSTEDTVLRKLLADPEVFEETGRRLTVTAEWMDGRAEPITEVHVMAGLLNRWREFVPDGRPVVLGLHPIGDARLCTNPLYGRGCSTGFWHADLLASVLSEHANDPMAQALALDAVTKQHLYPWYASTVAQDAEARRIAAALLAGKDPDGDPDDPRTFMRSVLREGLLPALRYDAVVLRAFVRNFNLLTPPDHLVTDPDVQARVLAVWQGRHQRPPEPSLGPPRPELLEVLEAPGA
jgi:2-polyprenyl-6-methoxyphenol hydroxylase-like FAD-dependent oxidoreductase